MEDDPGDATSRKKCLDREIVTQMCVLFIYAYIFRSLWSSGIIFTWYEI